MKTHFLKLFDYDKYANLLILQSMFAAGNPQKTEQIMAHLLMAQQVWLQRCKGLSPKNIAIWPDWKIETFEPVIHQNYAACTDFIQPGPGNFAQLIHSQNIKGESFQNYLGDILTHVINHGTHHRAQIGQLLKLNGLQPLPVTDYIVYLREEAL